MTKLIDFSECSTVIITLFGNVSGEPDYVGKREVGTGTWSWVAPEDEDKDSDDYWGARVNEEPLEFLSTLIDEYGIESGDKIKIEASW